MPLARDTVLRAAFPAPFDRYCLALCAAPARLARLYHPDKNPAGRDRFVAVQAAYERLQAGAVGVQGGMEEGTQGVGARRGCCRVGCNKQRLFFCHLQGLSVCL